MDYQKHIAGLTTFYLIWALWSKLWMPIIMIVCWQSHHIFHILLLIQLSGTAVDLEQDLKMMLSGSRLQGRDLHELPLQILSWRDVFLNNNEAVLEMLQRFSEDLSYLQRAIRWKEGDKL